ncbi:hypothetical protein [Planococcus sp. CAU13]|uniref:hypothetical protein n=1 Tax=Planococcus sp. CAU13 TaxID=1541197 RepID=UPI00052FDCC4|nr:hypothetical protein [Planococcus sp. CAU13]
MGFSEFIILLLIYSGLLIFFLTPFSKQNQSYDYREQLSFSAVFKKNLMKMISHKKAVFALLLIGLTLISIQIGFESATSHYNAHSGYSPVSNNLLPIILMVGLGIYTVALLLVLAYTRTSKIIKRAK